MAYRSAPDQWKHRSGAVSLSAGCPEVAVSPPAHPPHLRDTHEVGRVARVEADGSITFFDADGAARSHRPESLEVRRPGARGRLRWHTVSEVAVTWEQLSIF